MLHNVIVVIQYIVSELNLACRGLVFLIWIQPLLFKIMNTKSVLGLQQMNAEVLEMEA